MGSLLVVQRRGQLLQPLLYTRHGGSWSTENPLPRPVSHDSREAQAGTEQERSAMTGSFTGGAREKAELVAAA